MKPIVLIAAAVSLCSGAALAADAEQLLKEKACLSCHTLDKKLVGPAYKEVAAVLAGRMAVQTRLRVCGVVENMSFFECPHCGERTAIFGEGGGREAADTLGVPLLGRIPLMTELREGGDAGTPIVLSAPDSPAGRELRQAARELANATRTLVGKPLGLTVAAGVAGSGAGSEHAQHGHAH